MNGCSADLLLESYLAAQLAGDRAAAIALVMQEGLECGMSARELYLQVIQPAQYEIGLRWQRNELTVAQEHVATAISQLALAQLYAHLPRAASTRRRVVVACVDGEQHELGARMVADFVEMAGHDVRFVGAMVPADSLARLVQDVRADALCLSLATTLRLGALHDTVRVVRAALPHLPIIVGGRAFEWIEGRDLPMGARYGGADAESAARAVDEVLSA